MADNRDDGGANMRTTEIGTQNTTLLNSFKSKKQPFCCIICKLTSSNPKYNPDYVQQQQDRVAGRLERLGQHSGFKGIKHDHNHDDVLVDLQKFKDQVLMTANPPAGFQLSLDFLPCCQPPEGDGLFEGGWIAAASSDTGLLLCTTGKFSQFFYYICNPFTKQWAALPPAPRLHTRVHIGFIVENFTTDINDCSFQVVRFHNEYQCQQLHPRSHYEVETFSSQTGEWTIQTVYPPREMSWAGDDLSFQSIYHHRRLHWLAHGLVVYDPYEKKIIGIIKDPIMQQACRNYTFGGIGLSAGSFWISQFARSCLDLRFWQLGGYDAPTDDLDQCFWRPMFKFNFMDLTGGPQWAHSSGGGRMLAIHPHHPNIVYLQLCGDIGCYLVECNLLTKTMGQAMVPNDKFRLRGDIITIAVTSAVPQL